VVQVVAPWFKRSFCCPPVEGDCLSGLTLLPDARNEPGFDVVL